MSFRLFLVLFLVVSNATPSWALSFSRACDSRRSEIVISGVGDIMAHVPLQNHAYRYGMRTLWSNLNPYFRASDINYANLETPLAEGVIGSNGREARDPGMTASKGGVYSGFPLFNAHPSLAEDLAQFFDVVSTANNHSMDRGPLGVDRTIEALQSVGLAYTGTITQGSSRQWHTIVSKSGWNVAFVACTFSTNGVADPRNQVLGCFSNRSELLEIVSQLAQTPRVDAVIVTPHWGDAEYTHTPDARNRTLGRALIDAGATAVIGTHPHVIQPWEKHTTASGREGLIVYSTGNFVSNQFFNDHRRIKTRLGMMVFLGLSKNANGTWINGVRNLPLWMQKGPYIVNPIHKSEAPQGAYDLSAENYGNDRMLRANENLVTNPEC